MAARLRRWQHRRGPPHRRAHHPKGGRAAVEWPRVGALCPERMHRGAAAARVCLLARRRWHAVEAAPRGSRAATVERRRAGASRRLSRVARSQRWWRPARSRLDPRLHTLARVRFLAFLALIRFESNSFLSPSVILTPKLDLRTRSRRLIPMLTLMDRLGIDLVGTTSLTRKNSGCS